MADNDDRPENDTTDPTSDEHGDVHRRFVVLWNERASGDAGALALDSAWQPIANMLENQPGRHPAWGPRGRVSTRRKPILKGPS